MTLTRRRKFSGPSGIINETLHSTWQRMINDLNEKTTTNILLHALKEEFSLSTGKSRGHASRYDLNFVVDFEDK